MRPRRYQLRKDAAAIIRGGHPWIFREQLSSAASVFADGDWLRLVDGSNQVVGHGIYEADGAIAIRILSHGDQTPNAAWLRRSLADALARRADLAKTTDGIRLLNGESDGIPAVVADRFGDTIVVSSYSLGADALARYIAAALAPANVASLAAGANFAAAGAPANTASLAAGANFAAAGAPANTASLAAAPSPADGGAVLARLASAIGPATRVLLRPARRRRGPSLPVRLLRGTATNAVAFTEDDMQFAVDLEGGHKTGTYLDLRGLRRAVAAAPLASARVLNLFAYSGMLGRAAEAAGAAEIVQVDQSDRALAFAAAHHMVDSGKHRFVTADIFDWLPAQPREAAFDLVIVDPPSMTSKKSQVPQVLAAYRKLYAAAAPLVRPGGVLVSACCTSRIERDVFRKTVQATLGERFALERDLPPEPDHPVTFPQADYLKVLWWRRSP